jgi:Flp pilus assembly protein TadD
LPLDYFHGEGFMRSLISTCGVFLLIVVSSGPPAVAQNENTPLRAAMRISVMVRMPNGSPAPLGIDVRLEGDPGGLVDQQMTDSSGRVTFIPKDLARYVVIVHQRGYKDAEAHADLTLTPTAGVSITLVPDPEQQEQSPKSGGSGLDSTISASDLGIPEPARKEFAAGQKLLEEKHDAGKSIGHFRKATELYPGFGQAYLMLGLAYLQDQKLSESKTALERAIEIDPKSAGAYLALGACLNQQKDYAGAEKVLSTGLEMEPESPEGNYEIAKTYWALRRWQEAEPHARKAEELQPQVPGVHVLMGNILLQRRDNAGALKEFKEYLRLDPNGPMSEAVRNMTAKLEKAGTNP